MTIYYAMSSASSSLTSLVYDNIVARLKVIVNKTLTLLIVSNNLLFLQTRDAILKGAHPVSIEVALQFAGMQCQIQFGDYDERKHKPGFLE